MCPAMESIAERGDRPCYDREALLQRVADDRELLRELLRLFQVDSQVRLHALDEAIERGDLPAVAGVAHSLRGMVLVFSAEYAAGLAGEIEKRARSRAAEGVPGLAVRLRSEIDTLAEELEAEVGRPAAAGGGIRRS